MVQETQEILVAGAPGDLRERLALFGGESHRLSGIGASAARAQRQMQGVATEGEEVGVHRTRIPAVLFDLHGEARDGQCVAGEDADEGSLEKCQVDAAEQADGLLLVDHAVAEGGELVEQRDAVADATLAGAGEQ